jgi:hypothetical protein
MELVSIVAGLVHVYVDDVFTVVVGQRLEGQAMVR